MVPLYKDDEGVPVFSVNQVDDYGCPSLHGYTRFIVIESPMYTSTVPVYKKPQRPTHRYNRCDRFQKVLGQLMGFKLNISKKVLNSDKWVEMCEVLAKRDTPCCWKYARKILKQYKFSVYYNRIPAILAFVDNYKVKDNRHLVSYILRDFEKMHNSFSLFKDVFKRKYFFNLRFVALALMYQYGASNPYCIPLTITKQKAIALCKDFNFLWCFINSQ